MPLAFWPYFAISKSLHPSVRLRLSITNVRYSYNCHSERPFTLVSADPLQIIVVSHNPDVVFKDDVTPAEIDRFRVSLRQTLHVEMVGESWMTSIYHC